MMLKVTQLETLCELQQTEIVSLRKTVKEHRRYCIIGTGARAAYPPEDLNP